MRIINKSNFKSLMLALALGAVLTSCSEDEPVVPQEPVAEPILLDCATISVATTLTNRGSGVDYIVPCYINVEAPLTIEPGVTIVFKEGAGMLVNDYGSRTGSINAVGTAELPIVFTGQTATPGSWKNIEIASNKMANKFHYCTIQYAGNSDGLFAAVKARINGTDPTKIEIQNTTIRNNKGIGVSVWTNSIIDGWSSNTLTGNGSYPLEIAPNKVKYLDGTGSTYTGNTKNQINVYSQSILSTKRGYITAVDGPVHTWENPGVTFHVSEFIYVRESGHLKIMEGCQITFGQEYGIELQGEDDIIEVLGTAAKPVSFSGLFGAGSWKGISITQSNSNLNKIEHTTIADAGQSAWNFWLTPTAGISLGFSTVKNVKLKLNKVHISNSGGCGIAKKSNISGTGLVFTDVTYSSNVGDDVCTQTN